ncbi:MAG: nucleoside-diphosphate sugar epimerase [Verrucomicrobiaceae bacterium]|nr:nucleoside-diphosphate sugar epimerase [Verrucomicrobiaceae bacterium]
MKDSLPRFSIRPLSMADRLYSLPRNIKQIILISFDLCVIPIAVWVAIVLRWGGMSFQFTASELLAVATTIIFSAIIFIRTGLYRAMVRYMGQQALTTVVKDVSWSTIALALSLFLFRSDAPRSTPLIYWAITLFFIGGGRLLVRSSYQNLHRWSGKKVAIYGAGDSGRQLLQALFQSGEFAPMVFLDDSRNLHGTVINGIPVYDPNELPQLIGDMDITHVLLALPNAERSHKRKIIDYLTSLPIHIKTIPSFSALVSGLAQVSDIVDVDVEDLLGRETVPPQPLLLTQCITNKVVLVTGAGGSIGGELCRQIFACAPRELILVDTSEFNLYSIHRELVQIAAQKSIKTSIIPLLSNVQNERKMRGILTQFGVNTVYHAAAYKHVPIVEHNIAEGIDNNVFGTLATARAAAQAKVETFVLVSTDKAVRPTNIMGATKRIAELIVQAGARKYPDTKFCMVRFGNVLGSSGSVVPLFREQINKGGPVTVTHPDVQRYFMTIPEAAQLVLQAGAMGSEGDVFVLDMGEPVYIIDLAKRMIKLMGHVEKTTDNAEGNIEIRFIGLRAGEKLVEELMLGDKVTGTIHPKILRAQEEWIPEDILRRHLIALRRACEVQNYSALKTLLKELVRGFETPAIGVDFAWQKNVEQGSSSAKNIYPLFSSKNSDSKTLHSSD